MHWAPDLMRHLTERSLVQPCVSLSCKGQVPAVNMSQVLHGSVLVAKNSDGQLALDCLTCSFKDVQIRYCCSFLRNHG